MPTKTRTCKNCGTEKPLDLFPIYHIKHNHEDYSGRRHTCTDCYSEYRKQSSALRRADPNVRDAREWKRMYDRYGLSRAEYYRLHAAQGGVCAIPTCQETTGDNGRRLEVDHCHDTGVVRGLLCGKCNRALGLANDNPTLLRAMSQYLEDYRAK